MTDGLGALPRLLKQDFRLYLVAPDRPPLAGAYNFGPAVLKLIEGKTIDDVLAAQVKALITVVRAGGDIRTANLDDRLFIDRLQDTLDAR